MKLSIIIVSYNTAELTLQTVQSVESSLKKNSILKDAIEIIVVDNNSSDDSVKQLKKFQTTSKIPLKIIENKENLGFAKANNQGIRQTKQSTVLLLNSDTIVDTGALEKMYACLVSQQVTVDTLGIVSAQLQNPDGTYQPQGGSLPTFFSIATHQLMLDDLPLIGSKFQSTQFTGKNFSQNQSMKEVQDIGWVAGTAMMISPETIDTIGVLDEKIFMYGEDIEYCLRARDHGFSIAICNEANIVHIQSASSSSKNAILGEIKGYLYIWSKHKPLYQISWLKLLLKIGTLMRIFVFSTMERNPTKVSIYKEAYHLIK